MQYRLFFWVLKQIIFFERLKDVQFVDEHITDSEDKAESGDIKNFLVYISKICIQKVYHYTYQGERKLNSFTTFLNI